MPPVRLAPRSLRSCTHRRNTGGCDARTRMAPGCLDKEPLPAQLVCASYRAPPMPSMGAVCSYGIEITLPVYYVKPSRPVHSLTISGSLGDRRGDRRILSLSGDFLVGLICEGETHGLEVTEPKRAPQ